MKVKTFIIDQPFSAVWSATFLSRDSDGRVAEKIYFKKYAQEKVKPFAIFKQFSFKIKNQMMFSNINIQIKILSTVDNVFCTPHITHLYEPI